MLLSKKLQELLDEKLAKLNALRPISKVMLMKLREKFEVDMTYNSNAIEGNSLTLKETFWIVQEGLTIKGRPIKDILEAKSHKDALDFLYDLIDHSKRNTFSERTIKELHQLIMQPIEAEYAGRYRNVNVFISGSPHTPPRALQVPGEMEKFIDWTVSQKKKMHIVEFAAIAHHKFVNIHPFADGNGRTGRLLMNVFLMHHGFPLTIIQKNDRKQYYRVLQEADEGNYQSLIDFVAQATLRSLNIYLDVLTPDGEKEDYMLLSDVVEQTPYTLEYLSKLARQGKLDAHKVQRNWVTTCEAVERYVRSTERSFHKKK
ncbi:MAG: Fic family protein [Candidatus Gracilibacteria bacterium]